MKNINIKIGDTYYTIEEGDNVVGKIHTVKSITKETTNRGDRVIKIDNYNPHEVYDYEECVARILLTKIYRILPNLSATSDLPERIMKAKDNEFNIYEDYAFIKNGDGLAIYERIEDKTQLIYKELGGKLC